MPIRRLGRSSFPTRLPLQPMLLTLLWSAFPADGFVLNGGVSLATTNLSYFPSGAYRWTVPASGTSTDGLGLGISWVLDDGFCADMVGLFPERDILPFGLTLPSAFQFVHCSDIRDAMQRGFATWSANHRLIKFVDVSTAAPCASASSRTGAMSDTCPWELFVGTDDGLTHTSLAAYVTNHRRSEVDPQWFAQEVRSSSGVPAYGIDAHARSVMRFQTHLCWYLDATFCWYFQQLQEDHGLDVLLLTRALLFSLFGLAVFRLFLILFWCLVALFCLRGEQLSSVRKRSGCSAGCSACLEYLSSLSPCANLVVLFFLIFPLIFYDRIFLPCHQCYDFEAAVAHEAGHVLGFGHPDDDPSANIAASCSIGNATCLDPFGGCGSNVPYQPSERSIMQALTQQSPRTCLSKGDLDGLQFLYPLCDELVPTAVSCLKGRRLSGWLRLAIVTGVPFLLAVAVVLLPLTCLRWRDRRRIKRLEKQVTQSDAQVRAYQNELHKALRATAMDALQRPGTALRDAIQRPGTALRNSLGRGKNPRVAPAGGEARPAAAPRAQQGSAAAAASKKGAAAAKAKAAPGKVVRQATYNGYTGPAWPGAPPAK